MAWTQAELDALKAAYAQGVTNVSYEGKSVTYDSGANLLKRIREIEGEMASTNGKPKPVAGFVRFSRG
ncbi:MAG: hypothetical protein GY772_25600 [bacterium]|nr:hypothetical protein [bacterium]